MANEEYQYVIVVNHDLEPTRCTEENPARGPLVWEQYLDTDFSTDLEKVIERAKRLAKRYGGARVARLDFLTNHEGEK